jgi:hypothetical protein
MMHDRLRRTEVEWGDGATAELWAARAHYLPDDLRNDAKGSRFTYEEWSAMAKALRAYRDGE